MSFDLKESKVLLIEMVIDLLAVPDFLLLVEEHDSVIKDGILYWNRHFNQGYVVVNTATKQVHLVSNTDEDLTSENLCDSANIQLTSIDINEYVNNYSESRAREIMNEIDKDILLATQEKVLAKLYNHIIH